MRFNLAWLKEWVEPGLSTPDLAHALTMAGLEVDAVTPVAAEFDSVVVGRVLTVEPHPNADRLRVCTVDVAAGDGPLSIVCGAANVAPNMKVPTAVVGARLPGGLVIKKAKLRGVESSGMLCSASELGLAEQSSGLMPLPEDAPVGEDFRRYLELDDVHIELGLTPNRGDCLSVYGVAREVAAVASVPLKSVDSVPVKPTSDAKIPVAVEAPEACPRYLGRIVRGLSASAVTPLWMREKLRRCGLRSIHPVVDVTNYVLLELGQPMHAFDLAKLTGGIVVRYGKKGEKLALLDGQTVELSPQTLVIADQKHPLALAGIMGGAASAVCEATTDIVLEAAFFSPSTLAGKARSYGLHTDSSHRFERGVDPEMARRAMERATALILEICGGQAGPVVEASEPKQFPTRPPIGLRMAQIKRLLGIDVSVAQVSDILRRLGMGVVEEADGVWTVTPPLYRFDVAIAADLIEEVARVYGYDHVPATRPATAVAIAGQSEKRVTVDSVRQWLVGQGYQEAITYSFVDPNWQNAVMGEEPAIALVNPIAADMGVMRTTLWAGLFKALQYNMHRQQTRVRLFEIGTVFLQRGGVREERTRISGVCCGSAWPEQWGTASRPADFFDVKADVAGILGLTGSDRGFTFRPDRLSALHPSQTAAIVNNEGNVVGWLGTISPVLQKLLDVDLPVIVFELDWDQVAGAALPKFKELSRFPAVRRDLAVVVDLGVEAEALCKSIRRTAGEVLTELTVFDVYAGKGIDSGRKSLAVGLTLQASERTLTDSEVDLLIQSILKNLWNELGATLRE